VACKTLNGYAVIDTQSRTPVTPVYGVAANPNQSVDAANMVDMTKIAGMLNLMHSRVQIPDIWQFTGTSSTQNSTGRLYEVEKNVHIRIFFDLVTCRGGLCMRDSRNRSMKYTATTWNKTSETLNEWIANKQIFNN